MIQERVHRQLVRDMNIAFDADTLTRNTSRAEEVSEYGFFFLCSLSLIYSFSFYFAVDILKFEYFVN